MMLRAVLFDLDDTLLGNPMDKFLPAYFGALTRYCEHLVPPERLIAQLVRGTEAMNANHSEHLTNEEAFVRAFYPGLKVERSTLEPLLQRFYTEEFPRLRALTCVRPEARRLVQRALDRDLQVAVATNPMFPRVAVEHRLEWADVPVDEFDYALVTTYENMHATKSDPAYYCEVASRLGRHPTECLMVGDSWEMDVLPATSIGVSVYWVSEEEPPRTPDVALAGRGNLGELSAMVSAHSAFPRVTR